MCIVSDKIKFCTCKVDSYEELPNYWILYRYNKNKKILVDGLTVMRDDFSLPNYEINNETLRKRLNESDSFDVEIEFKANDRIEIVLNNLAENEIERMTFSFTYKKGEWIAIPYDTFKLMNEFDELKFGNFSQLKMES